jgi:hypothetical protein
MSPLNEKVAPVKKWDNFKIHVTAAYNQYQQIQGRSATTSGYANNDVAQPEDDFAEAAIDAFVNLTTVTAVDLGIMATFINANSRLAKQLEESDKALKEIRDLLKKEHNDRATHKHFLPSPANYYWTHGYNIAKSHTSQNCMFLKNGHKREATNKNNMGGTRQTRNDW